ncbi:isoaspartyl peptidase/L-asparaginase family protein [Pseudomarimonas salicorniae]|uniref:Isoaspartyl peptidase/L-asparaginase n=1 Tax=Pseudomarimonas salicorniae TaxID=2933270 RepID=A0ABT0GIL9_9GAMM|nr:isoaspartyl peptidase/L-asparaginase [Lysobacter sp. CAU 1642]MCK7594394.1 isoaspartyl peptidase/L-asparaginase [Lysobacter sp. CAU 1642]
MRAAACLLLALGFGASAAEPPIAIAIHGGAGTMSREALDPEREKAIRADLDRALDAGHALLREGRPALEAVIAAVVVLEDSPHFNAGKGAVFTHEGINELDAALMDGATRRAGAVAGVRTVRNPIRLAAAVMKQSRHVMLTGSGAEAFAASVGLEPVEPSYFRTEFRWQQLQEAKAKEAAGTAVTLPASAYFGTVGAVALDRDGKVAAATSTGGMTNKRWGRVGDAPIIGAGTWADEGCAVSATGWGEFFIRLNVASDICARVHYRGDALGDAAAHVIMTRVPELGGDGGVIAIDSRGNIALPFNTQGMYRGWVHADGSRGTAIFRDP